MSTKRKRLTLKEKIELINVAENEKLSLRDLGQRFGISKNQASHVLLEREEILEEVCLKQNLNPADFDICHYNKPLDLTLPVRFANLSNNAQLELQPVKVARKECLVTVGLQLESGERIMKDFVPSTSVWDVVEQCLSNRQDRNSLNEKGEPVCVYMRQTIIGKAMKETTLHGLGLTKGSAVIRLMYRNPDDLSDQAHLSTPLSKPKQATPAHSLTANVHENKCDKPRNENIQNIKPDNVESVKISSLAQEESTHSNDPNISLNKDKLGNSINESVSPMDLNINSDVLSKSNKVNEVPLEQKMELDCDYMDLETPTEVEEDIGAIHYIGGRHAMIYSLNDITDVKKADLPDDFFELTIDDAKYLMEQFKKSRLELENQPLLTKELRNRQLLQKLGRFKQTVIRIYFPERLVLQAVFEVQETVLDVCNFIRDYLEDKNLNFYLYTTPPKEKKDPAKTLIESMLIPAAVVYFGCDKQNSTYLSKSLKEKVSDPRAATLAAYESRKEAVSETEDLPSDQLQEEMAYIKETDADSYKVPATSFTGASGSIQTSEKAPKWFKMSKK